MSRLSDDDLQALVKACVDDGKSFSDTSKEVRLELGMPDIRTTVNTTIYGLMLAFEAGHVGCGLLIRHWYSVSSDRPSDKMRKLLATLPSVEVS